MESLFSASPRNATVRVGSIPASCRARIAEILEATHLFRTQEVEVSLELFDEASSNLPASSEYVFLGAFTPEDELAGFACYGPTPGTDRTYDLYWIAVHPALQGSGSGTILLNEVERRLKGLNARMLVVETSSRSDYVDTRGFYMNRGYVEAGRVRDFYAPHDDRITFIKRLQSRGGPPLME